MKASKNAHDWHCEDHDTYGWRGEACPLCPKARGEAEMIEQLKAENSTLCGHIEQLREAVKEGLRTYKVPMTARICEAIAASTDKRGIYERQEMNTDIFNEMLKKASYGTGVIKPCIDEIESLRQQLDAANTLIKKYREEMSQEQLDNWAAHQRSVEEKEMIEKYLRDFMAQQNGLPASPLVEAGLVYAGGPNNTWALTELGVEMLNGEGEESVEDVVNHPAHYTKGGIECIDAIQAALTPEEFRGYCKGNALKYIWRNGKKAPGTEVQDAEKAIWYLAKFNDTF